MAVAHRYVAPPAPRCLCDLHWQLAAGSETVGRGAPGRAGSGAQLRDRRRNSAPYRQTELANSRQCAEEAEPRPEYEDQGGGYPQIAGTCCGMAAAVAS